MATVEREIQQLPGDEIVAGAVPLATVRLSPDELTDRIGIDWDVGSDELGDLRSAVVEAGPDRMRYALVSYELSDPSEITLLGEQASIDTLDEVLRSLRIAENEVLDRVDWPTQASATEAIGARESIAALEHSLGAIQLRIEELQAKLELSRLASLASIEDVELTPRQREVLQLMISGLNETEVAEELQLSRRTVMDHLSRVRNALVHRP